MLVELYRIEEGCCSRLLLAREDAARLSGREVIID